MEHINDLELMEFAAGRLTASRSREVLKHITGCTECSERCQEAERLWKTLGQWNVDTKGHDIYDRIITSMETSRPDQRRSKQSYIVKGDFWADVLRIAASVVIAVLIGQRLGRMSTGQKMPPPVISQGGPNYISALGLELSSELTWLIMEEQLPEGEQ